MATRQITFMREAAQNAAIPKLTTGERKLDFLYADKFDEIKNRGGLVGGLEYVGASALAGVGGIGEGIFDLTVGGMNALVGNKVYAENLFKDNVVGEWHKDIRDSYNPDKVVSFFGDVGQGLGQSATMLIPYVGPYAFFAGVIGQSIGEATQQTGELGFKEVAYGAVSGGIEGALEYVLGKGGQAFGKVMKGIGGKAGASISSKLGSAALNKWAASAAWKGVAKDMISSAGGEFVEEFLSEYIDVGLKRGFKIDENASTSFGQAFYAGLVGAASGAAMGGAVSGVSTAFAKRAGQRVVDAGNSEVLVKETRGIIDDLKLDKSVKVDNVIRQLEGALEAYDIATAAGNTDAAVIHLGEIKTYRGMLEMAWGVQREAAKLAAVDDATAERYARYMSSEDGNREVSKNYTAKDFYDNKNNIRTRLAAMGWGGAFMSDTRAMRESAIYDAEIAADKVGDAEDKGIVPDIVNTEFPSEGGTVKLAAQGESLPDGDYMRVIKLGEDSYSLGVGNESATARGFKGLTREQAQAEFERIKGQVITARQNAQQAANLAAQGGVSGLRQTGARTIESAIAAEQTATNTAVPGTVELGSNPYEKTVINAARRAVKNFDLLDVDTKQRILRWVESAQAGGVEARIVSAVSNIMRIREGLQVIFAEVGEGKLGFRANVGEIGRNLIVTSTNLDTLRETLAHEIGHEVSGAEGFDQIKKAALKATKKEDRDKWAADYRRMFPGMSDPDVDEEVAMKALGRRLATPRFLDRYAENRTFMGKLIDTAKQMLEYLRAGKAGRLEIDTTEKLIKMMNEALITDNVRFSGKDAGNKQYALPSKKDPTKLDPRTVTRDDVLEMLENAGNGMYDDNTYIPIRISTPAIVIQRAKEKLNKVIPNYPLIMSAGKAINAMERQGYGDDGLPNRLAPEEIVNIIEAMSNPLYIVYEQETQEHPEPRYVEVVKFNLENGRKAFAVLELTGDFKDALYVNGYDSGNYNVFVTVYPPKDYKLKELLTNKNNVVIYDKKKDFSQVTSGITVPSVLNDPSFFTDSIAQKSEKSTPSAKKSHNIDADAADQASREAAEVEKSADQREKNLQKREDKAARAERDAEIKRIETRSRDYNVYYYKYDDIKALIDTINKEAKLGFSDVSDAAFAAFSQLNAFRAEVYKADYRQSFLETTTDYLIEAADAQAGRELRLGDIDRRKKVYKMLNEAYERLAKVTPKQKTEGRRARAEAEAQFEHKTAELHMLLNRVDQRNFRYKTAGLLEGEAWKQVTKAAKAMRTRGANVQFGAMKSFAEAFTSYLKSKATSLYNFAKDMTEESLKEWNKQVQEGDNELYKHINPKTARAIIEFAEGNDTDFTDSNIAATVAALKTALTVDTLTDRFVNENGEAVDADKIVADELDGMRKSFSGAAGKLARTTFGKALRYGIYNVISPEAVAHRMDGILGAGHLFKGIRAIQRSSLDAQYDQMVWMMPITEFIREQKKKNKTWWKDWQDGTVTITYSLPFGNGETKTRTITLTKGEAASLYLTSKREQAKAALALGRISVTDAEGRNGEQFSRRRFNMDAIDEWLDQNKFEEQTDEEVNAVVVQLEQAMQTAINGMYAQFNATDKAFIDKISNFYQTTSKKVKQASDTRYYGSTNVFDGFYYPIARSGLEFDFDFIGANMRGLDDVSLRNYPFNKSTVKGARAQLQINDILVVLDRHSRQLAMYKNLTIPMQNLRLVYNHRLVEGAKEGIDTVRKYINEYIWPSKNGRGGFDQWIGDFANAAQKRNIGGKTEYDTVLDKLQGGYVVAALGLNPSSIAKQWSTIMQMVEEVPLHIWMKAYAPAENKDKMLEKSRYASVRKNNSEIYFAQGTTAKLNDVMSYTLKGLEAGDYFVNLRMWNMAQYYVAETRGFAVGSEQNLNAAGKVLDEWILRFQDTSDATTKSALQRHPQKLAQTVTMFTSAPMKKFSAWYTHLTDAVEADRLIKSGKLSDEDRKRAEKILSDSKKKLAKSSGGIVAAAAFETAVTLLWAALRGKDDEDEEKKKSLVAKIALETSANVVGIVPVAGQIAESLLSGYDIDNMYESVINDGIGTVRTTYQLSAKALSGEQVESEAVMRNARNWVYLVSQTLGVPVRNLNNVFTAALNVISPVVPQAKYKYDAIFYEPTYAADMSKALKSGKTELAETIYRMSQKDIKTGGAADSSVVGEMVRLYGMEYNVLPRSAPTSYEDAEGNTVKLRAAQSRQFSEIYGAADGAAAMVVTSPVYTALSDELKAKALRVVYEIYHSRAKTEVFGAEPSVMAALSYFDAYIDVPTLVAESAYIYGIKSTKDAKRSELVREYISGYSPEAQAVLLYAAGYRSDDIKETLAEMLASLDEDAQNRAKIKLDF